MGCRTVSRALKEFMEFIDNYCFSDLPLTIANLGWASVNNSSSKTMLDRFLIPIYWEERVPNVLQVPIPRFISDHSPIMLDGSKRSMCAPFRFENM